MSRMDGGEFTVFDRSVLVSNGAVHDQVGILKSSLFPYVLKFTSSNAIILQY